MLRVFKMQVGKDYKVISFQGESERVAGAAQRRRRRDRWFGAERAEGA